MREDEFLISPGLVGGLDGAGAEVSLLWLAHLMQTNVWEKGAARGVVLLRRLGLKLMCFHAHPLDINKS